MFNYENDKIKDNFELEKLIGETITLFEKYGSIDKITIDCNSNIEILDLVVSLDYGDK